MGAPKGNKNAAGSHKSGKKMTCEKRVQKSIAKVAKKEKDSKNFFGKNIRRFKKAT